LLLAAVLAGTFHSASAARGVSPYLPLDMAPEMERQIERVLILADKPITSRPIPAATVLDALPAACRLDEHLCASVRRYLDRYMHKLGVAHASAEGAAVDGVSAPMANRHGMASDSSWRASAQVYWQPTDHVLVSAGGIAYDDDAVATGSLLSLGFEYAQLDVGFRDHWFSPFTDSAMIISTQAQTLPSVTLSNYKPILGFSYEIFLAEMEYSDRIAFEDGFTAGHPRLAGMRLSFEPTPGWSIGANRMMQFGGGERGGDSFGDFIDALFKPRQADNRSDSLSQDEEFGNQVAAFTSRFIFPGPTPFAAYLEYAGEDTSFSGNLRLGNAALSIGLNFPRLWDRFDLTYEFSELQNGWYVHGIYQDGLTQAGHVLGHWAADNRVFEDAVGAQTHMLRIGWEPPFGGLLQLRGRTVENQDYGAFDYQRGYDVTLGYSRPVGMLTAGAEIMGGRDVFGESYGRLAGFVRFGDVWSEGVSPGWSERSQRPPGAELFVDGGININKVSIITGDGAPTQDKPTEAAPHVAIGARRAVSNHSDLGVRAEFDQVDGELLLAVRALDYRYRFDSPLAASFFIGAARYDAATPAYGYYFGAGVQWRNILPRCDLGLDLRYADKVARDKLLPSDPPVTPRNDMFFDISSVSLSLSYRW
jgi:hypothetical protein